LKIPCFLALWLLFEWFGLVYYDNYFPELMTNIIGASSLIACYLLFIYFGVSVIKRKKMQIKNGCQEILDQQNRILQGRGLKWRLPEEFPDWIELCKDENNHNFIRPQSEREPENDIEEGIQGSRQGYQKKFKNKIYALLPEDV